MPTVLRIGPYRFFFYSADCDEPPHIHVARDDDEAKFWLDPVAVAYNSGFSKTELRKIQGLIESNRGRLLEEWNDHCGGGPAGQIRKGRASYG